MILNGLVNMIYPRRCAICDTAITRNMLVCERCSKEIKPITGDTCQKCGKSMKNTCRLYCYDCSRKVHIYDKGFSIFEYAQIKQSLYRFKYSGRAEYAKYYAYETNRQIGSIIEKLGADALIPVPIHKKRFKDRGYNQAFEFAKELSALTKIPVLSDYIIREKETIPLKLLDATDRANNLKKAFIIRANSVELETIIIIDDIYTTGSTIDEISRECRSVGIKKIYFITVAIGSGL